MDILTVPGKGLPVQVKRFDAPTLAQVDSLFAYDDDFKSGAFLGGT